MAATMRESAQKPGELSNMLVLPEFSIQAQVAVAINRGRSCTEKPITTLIVKPPKSDPWECRAGSRKTE
jgi:hypothetical protein